MKFVLLSTNGDSWFLGRRLLREGHDVAMHVFDPWSRKVGDGLIPKLETPNVPHGTDVVLFDDTGYGAMGERLRKRGIAVIGGNPLDADLEENRTLGTRFMRQAGIKTPETHSFSSVAQGQAFLATHPGDWFFKPSGEAATDLTRNGDAAAVRRFLAWAGTHLTGEVRGFELQRAVVGAEVSIEGWFDGSRWIGPCNSTLETKKFCADDLGPRTGCQANVVWAYQDERPLLFQKTLERMTPLLSAARYVGPLDLNCMIDEGGTPIGLEWSARFGFDALQALSLLIQGNLGHQLHQFATGKLRRWDLRPDVMALTLRLSTSPYPIEDARLARESEGLPLDPALFGNPTTTFLDDVMVGKDGKPVLAGRDGSVCCLGVTGRHWQEMKAQVLRRAAAIDIPSKAYRVDVIPDAEDRWAELAYHDYITASDVPGLVAMIQPTLHVTGGTARTARDGAVTDEDDDPPMPPFVHSTTEGEAAG